MNAIKCYLTQQNRKIYTFFKHWIRVFIETLLKTSFPKAVQKPRLLATKANNTFSERHTELIENIKNENALFF